MKKENEMAFNKDILHTSGEELATGNSGSNKVTSDVVIVSIRVSAMTTGTCDFSLLWSPDGTNFAAKDGGTDTFTQATAAATLTKAFASQGLFYRLVWTIAASGDPTFYAAGVQTT